MIYNQFLRTITTPSLLAFYAITIFGAYFVALITASLVSLAPLFSPIGIFLEENIERSAIFAAVGLLTVISGIGGYFGLGPTEVLDSSDEFILMPGPVQPHQLFIARYVRRIIRKIGYIFIGIIIVIPLLQSAHLLAISLLLVVISIILFLEFNYFVGGFCSIIKAKVELRTRSRLRHVLLLGIASLLYIPTLPGITESPIVQFGYPSNALSVVLMESFNIYATGISIAPLVLILMVSFIISMLALANITDYDMYEVFSAQQSREESEGTFSRRVRGQVDFSASRFNDPVMWIILKDFWSKMRTPLQFWKYVYVIFGVAIGLLINILQPIWLTPIPIPPQFMGAITPAFLLVLILLTQMGTLPSLLAFVDEKDNIYLLRSSPFRSNDIVLAKYLMSVIEISLTSLPLYLFILYFFRVPGAVYLIALAAPMIMVFSATGIMAGAYVPVFTNDPKNPPVPLAFSFPAINLILGGIIVWITSEFFTSPEVLVILPFFTMTIVLFFLFLSNHALESYK